jgi:hypothetical protein
VPYQIFYTNVFSPEVDRELNSYYGKNYFVPEKAEATAVLIIQIIVVPVKPYERVTDPQNVENQVKLWLRTWIACERPDSGQVFSLKQKTELAFK